MCVRVCVPVLDDLAHRTIVRMACAVVVMAVVVVVVDGVDGVDSVPVAVAPVDGVDDYRIVATPVSQVPNHAVFQRDVKQGWVPDIAVLVPVLVPTDMTATRGFQLDIDQAVVTVVVLAPQLVPNDWLATVLAAQAMDPNDSVDSDSIVQCHRQMQWCNLAMVHVAEDADRAAANTMAYFAA